MFKPIFESAVTRPFTITGREYNKVSNALYNNTFNVLSGRIDGKTAVTRLER